MSPWCHGLASGRENTHLLMGPSFEHKAGKLGILSGGCRFGPKYPVSIAVNQGWQSMAYSPNLGSYQLVNKVFGTLPCLLVSILSVVVCATL